MNPNDQYGLWTFVFLIRLTEQSVNHHLREFNIPQKNTNELGPAWHIAGNHRIRGQKKIAFSYSDAGGTLENKLNDLKPLFSRKKSLTFQKRSKKMLLQWRANLADQNKQQPLKLNIRVTYHTVFLVCSLRSWRYCVGARLKFWRRSRVPKKREKGRGGWTEINIWEHLRSNPVRNTYRRKNHRKWLLSMHVTNQLRDLLMLSLVWQKKIYSVKV